MTFRPRLQAVLYGVVAALASTAAVAGGGWGSPTLGDSGQSPNTVMANQMNPRGLDPSLIPDSNGLGPYRSPVSHTPTGQLYSVPWEEPRDHNGLSGSIEVGIIESFADEDAAKFKEYRDMSDGLLLNHFNLSASGSDGTFFNVEGGSVGREDQYYFGNAGRYNDWKVRGFYNEIPHVFSTTAKVLWSGGGTNNLTLLPQFGYSRTANAALNGSIVPMTTFRSLVSALPDTDIELTRKKGGFRLDKTLPKGWNFYAEYSLEKRQGDRTFGQTGGGFPDNANGGPIEVLEPINYNTHEAAAGLSWADKLNALNIRFEASIFQDANKEVQWENPFVNPTLTGNGHIMQFSTPPDNQEYGLKVDYARQLPQLWDSSLNVTLSFATQSNDDDLAPETSHQGLDCNTVTDCSYVNQLYKNGIPTLSQMTSDLRNDISLAYAKWSLHPADNLALNANVRWYNQATHNEYLAYNPAIAAACGASFTAGSCAALGAGNTASGPYGYSGEDTVAGGASSATNSTNTANRRRSTGASYRQINAGVGADWDFADRQSLNFTYDHEDVYRALRERDWTDENKLKFGYVNRGLGAGTLRASYEWGRRRGSDWKVDGELIPFCGVSPTDPAFGGCQQTFITTNGAGFGVFANTARAPLGQKHDLNDRDSHTLIARYNYMFTNTLDGMVTAKEQIQFFPDLLGRDTRREHNLSFDLNYQPTTTTQIGAYYTYQAAYQSQMSLNDDSGTAGDQCTAAQYSSGNCSLAINVPGSGYYNPNQFFRYDTDDINHVFGLTFGHLFANKVKLDSTMQYTRTRSPMDYATVCGLAAPAVAPNGGLAQACTGAGALAVAGVGTPTIYVAANGAPVGTGVIVPSAFSFPDMVYNRWQFNLGVQVPISQQLGVRFIYMFDHASISDWHYDGLAAAGDAPTNGAGTARDYYLDSGPAQPYTTHTVGAFLQWKM